MKSVIVNGYRSFANVEKPMPEAGGKWVTIKVKNCAICGSDNSFWTGLAGGDDFTLGHEFSGYIEDPGEYDFKRVKKSVLLNLILVVNVNSARMVKNNYVLK